MSAVTFELFPRIITVDEEFVFFVAQVDPERRHLHVDGVLSDSCLSGGYPAFAEFIHGIDDRPLGHWWLQRGRSDVSHTELGIILVCKVERREDGGTVDGVTPPLRNVVGGGELLVELCVGLEGGA